MFSLTLPDCLSLARVALLPAFACSLLRDWGLASVSVYCLAVASDIADGHIARQRGAESARGTLIDHGADACLVTGSCAVFAYLDLITPLLAPLVALAFVQYALSAHPRCTGRPRGSRLGRWNGIAYFALVACALVVHHFARATPLASLPGVLAWVLVITTLVSIAARAMTPAGDT